MSVVWTGLFGVLVVECTVLCVLLMPLPAQLKRSAVEGIANSRLMASGRSVRMFFYACTLAMFVESVRQLQNDEEGDKTAFDAYHRSQIRKFRAQRNVYLTFFALFLVFVIERTCKLIIEHSKSARMLEVLQKQASNNQKAFERLADEKAKVDKATKDTKDVVEDAAKTKKEAKDKLKQAENQAASFVQLVEELTELKNTNKILSSENDTMKSELKSAVEAKEVLQGVVDDYDDLLGDHKKKAI